MLGDAGIQRVSPTTARLDEFHSIKQKLYLDWKVCEWGSFISRVSPKDKGKHKGFRFYTSPNPIFSSYHNLFYPSGYGDKTCIHLDPDQVDDFALAVWFMDDGSRSGNYVRFSVGPDLANQEAQLRILSRFGLRGRLYNSDPTDCSIHIQDRTNLNRFLDIVGPHIHPTMSYKLDFPKKPKPGKAPRDILTVSILADLGSRGLSAREIGVTLGVSRQSVLRAIARLSIVG